MMQGNAGLLEVGGGGGGGGKGGSVAGSDMNCQPKG